MIDLVKFSPFIYPVLPELSDMEFIAYTRRACIDFCRRSLVWQQDLPAMDINASQNVYALAIPEGSELTRIMRVAVDEEDYMPVSESNGMSFGYSPFYISRIESREMQLVKYPQLNSPNGLEVRVALQPAQMSMQVPDILYTHYSEAIAVGALSSLYAITGRAFSDPQRAEAYREDFRHMINSATSDAAHGFSRATFSTKESYI
jgi:hypothetical protein